MRSKKMSKLDRFKFSRLKVGTPGAAFPDWVACYSAAETDRRRISRVAEVK